MTGDNDDKKGIGCGQIQMISMKKGKKRKKLSTIQGKKTYLDLAGVLMLRICG